SNKTAAWRKEVLLTGSWQFAQRSGDGRPVAILTRLPAMTSLSRNRLDRGEAAVSSGHDLVRMTCSYPGVAVLTQCRNVGLNRFAQIVYFALAIQESRTPTRRRSGNCLAHVFDEFGAWHCVGAQAGQMTGLLLAIDP